ncbi:MAG: hypothetical protein M0Q19_05990 [Candidatus Cloacimonetes bacterium]|nr:hypothetical protein [Candidatus Cloacimonadota bacterium]MCK9332712.1 hypothetical protein [Candidatus Cloacimonadota bacterium]
MNRFRIAYLLIVIFPLLGAFLGSMLSGAEDNGIGISFNAIALAAALLTGVLALLQHYLNSFWQVPVAIFMAIIYSALSMLSIDAPISIFALILPNTVYALLSLLIVRFIFYNRSIFRLRTLIMGILGGIMFSLYLAAIFTLLRVELGSGFWNASFVYGLIIYVFIAFSMSIADLVILQLEVKELQQQNSEDDQ